MCGIAGIYSTVGKPVDCRVLQAMGQAQAHRGPDGEGYVLLDPSGKQKPASVVGRLTEARVPLSPRHTVALAHRRLAILDLSALGAQPMTSEDRRDWITYNGELYNYVELRAELRAKGYRFRSTSDTEVLLAAYREWGEDCLGRFNGMFAFALWDGVRGRLFCARDRLGEKPFYYGWDGERFVFASEIKALLLAYRRPKPNQRAVFEYLDSAMLDHTDGTFFEGIQQLLPAHFLIVQGATLTSARYWALPVGTRLEPDSARGGAERLRELLCDSVRIRLRSDVPVGSCLSGGLDSSSIVCLMRAVGNGQVPLRTFSSCFEDPAYDERQFIAPVVQQTKAEAHYAFPDPKELADTVGRLIWQQDEPFGSTSIFAQWNVMRLASQQGVKVILDGQGADELLAGYQGFYGAYYADLLATGRAVAFLREWCAYRRLHGPLSRYALANLVRSFMPEPFVNFIRSRLTGSATWLNQDFRRQHLRSHDSVAEPRSNVQGLEYRLLTGNGLRALLRYEDRNSMAFGIEARLPFLDHRLVEFLYGLGAHLKIRDGWTKAVLRDAMDGLLPEAVRWRSDKMGFVTPEDHWFRSELRDSGRAILSDDRARLRGYLNVEAALQAFDDHVAGRVNIGNAIWRWINVELWSRCFVDRDSCTEPMC